MTETAVEFTLPLSLFNVPANHRAAAERKAREAFVLSLLRQGDVSAGRAAELLDVNRGQLSQLMSAHGISPFDETQTREELENEVMDALSEITISRALKLSEVSK